MSRMIEESNPAPPALADAAEDIPPIAKKIHLGRIAAASLVVTVLALGLLSLARNEQLKWDVIGEYMFKPQILDGLQMTLKLTAISMVVALILAIVLANMRLSPNPVLRVTAWVYVWFFRGVPLLVLLILMFNLALLYPRLSIGIPGLDPFWSTRSQDLISPFWAAVVAFVLHQSAYSSEVIRSSIMAVPKGQIEAAESLGMTHVRTLRRIVLPQAMRIAIPPIANDTITLLKSTSLVAFIAVTDLLYSVQLIYTRNYEIVPLLMVATIWYVLLVSVMSLGQWQLERRFGRGVTRLTATARQSEGTSQ